MKDVYQECPVLQNGPYLLRLVKTEDIDDLLEVYSDRNALPFFNSDNCHGDFFYYETKERMTKAMEFWLWAYQQRSFVRWAIEDQVVQKVVGTIEAFRREAKETPEPVVLLRLDIRSEYERREQIESILSAMIPEAYEIFDCSKVITKAAVYAVERIRALKTMGFQPYKEGIVGENGTVYGGYWYVEKES